MPLAGNLHYLPRGARWQFGSVRFVAIGGAVSIGSPMRTAGLDFFVEEEVGGDDVARVVAGGPADVLVCHDAPAGWEIPNLPPVERMPLPVAARVDAANRHRVRLRTAYEAVRPAVVVHGHYHSRCRTLVDEAWGQVLVEGLDCDGTEGAFMVMDCTAALSKAPVHIRLT